ncbi:MAG: DUF1572 family protein [Candidatus Eisenbacteria bacterium]|uniref:DUF1572 family protein n=1 Tax=Eiseniibacteriota bacterium TaxID=2212470 RepID=A0A956LZB2_UNCEI|nr:DUF1572 family protein [Candidatus Eisenbacteria bacterium]
MSENILELSLREFRRTKQLADRAIDQLTDEEIFRLMETDGNSVAIIVKHVAGNLRSRWRDFLTTDGEKPDRDRDSEFLLDAADTRDALLQRWEEGWEILFAALSPLSESDLTREVRIRGEGLSVLQAIQRQMTHYAYHVGQIVLLARTWRGSAWETLSVAKGQSQAFNRAPESYLTGGTDSEAR